SWRKFVDPNQQLAGLFPAFKSAIQGLRTDSLMPQPGSCALAELLPFLAHDDYRFALVLRRPLGDCTKVPAEGAGQQTRVSAVVLVRSHVDDRRPLRNTCES